MSDIKEMIEAFVKFRDERDKKLWTAVDRLGSSLDACTYKQGRVEGHNGHASNTKS